LVLVFNTFSGNGRTAERMAEWQKWIHTYYLWYKPTPMTPMTLKSFIV
jgi:hypothetical protein